MYYGQKITFLGEKTECSGVLLKLESGEIIRSLPDIVSSICTSEDNLFGSSAEEREEVEQMIRWIQISFKVSS